jgi:murein DD-endopeptidase MepM/ murein hydrolase activator NlpD
VVRASAQWIVLIALAASLSACANRSPRDPARVEYRTPSGGVAQTPSRPSSCSPGERYTVRSGDTLSQIAERCRVETRSLADANGLNAPYHIVPGQELVMPRARVHVVARGENLYRIGLRYGIDYRELASINNLYPPFEIEIGQEILLPDAAGSRTAAVTPPPATTVTTPTPRQTPSRPPAQTATTPPPAQTTSPPAATAPASFQWPLEGEIIARFGEQDGGRRNDGINIRAAEGDSVRAAAAGTVVYAGNELAGYGELILVRHDGGFVTAYANNSRLRVREGEQVQAGQIIAEAGSTGSVDSPQLHFEIRHGVTPEDPLRHLPRN